LCANCPAAQSAWINYIWQYSKNCDHIKNNGVTNNASKGPDIYKKAKEEINDDEEDMIQKFNKEASYLQQSMNAEMEKSMNKMMQDL